MTLACSSSSNNSISSFRTKPSFSHLRRSLYLFLLWGVIFLGYNLHKTTTLLRRTVTTTSSSSSSSSISTALDTSSSTTNKNARPPLKNDHGATTKHKRTLWLSSGQSRDATTIRGAAVATKEEDKKALGAFIHVGKTAGSTLSLLLRNGCHSFLPKPCRNITNESIVSKLIDSYYHVPDFHLLAKTSHRHHSFYIITLRDPFDRTISAFSYEHPLNNIDIYQGKTTTTNNNNNMADMSLLTAFRCFPSLERFVDHIGDNVSDFVYDYPPNQMVVANSNCRNLARAAMNSRLRIFRHLYFNYGKIRSLLYSTAQAGVEHNHRDNDSNNNRIPITIYATRKEHLWEDWYIINHLLMAFASTTTSRIGKDEGSANLVVLPSVNATASSCRNVSGFRLPVTRDLSMIGRRRLCRALAKEYEHYLFLLQSAQNLQERDVHESLAYSRQNCPNLDILQTNV